MWESIINYLTIKKCRKCRKMPKIEMRYPVEGVMTVNTNGQVISAKHNQYTIKCCGNQVQYLDTLDCTLFKSFKPQIKEIKKRWNKMQV